MHSVFSARNVTCAMPSEHGETAIFQGISFDVEAGQIIDLIGPSGAGKSSLLTAFARLNPHAHGDFTLRGRDAKEFTPQQWRREVAYLPQKPVLMGATVAEAIRLPWTLAVRNAQAAPTTQTSLPQPPSSQSASSAASSSQSSPSQPSSSRPSFPQPTDPQSSAKPPKRRHRLHLPFSHDSAAERMLLDSRIRELLDALGCADVDLNRPPQDLSGGQAARVSLARTLLTEPTVLLADEVDAGLDDENAAKVADIMADAVSRGMAVIRIRHRPPDGRASRIMSLADGVLTTVEGTDGGIQPTNVQPTSAQPTTAQPTTSQPTATTAPQPEPHKEARA